MLTLLPTTEDLWERFQRGGVSPREVVGHPVLERWRRAQMLGVMADGREPSRPALDSVALRARQRAASLVVRANELFSSARRWS